MTRDKIEIPEQFLTDIIRMILGKKIIADYHIEEYKSNLDGMASYELDFSGKYSPCWAHPCEGWMCLSGTQHTIKCHIKITDLPEYI